MTLTKAEEGQNRQNHNNQTNKINKTVHGFLLMSRPLIWSLRSPYSGYAQLLFEDAGLTEQLALFPQVTAVPEGLQYSAEFISPEFEREYQEQTSPPAGQYTSLKISVRSVTAS
jgi:hypothetical protein